MVDRYTKIVLTIIASSLVFIAVRDVPLVRGAIAQASTEPTAVVITGIRDPECSYPGQHRCDWDPLPVRD